MRLLLTISPRPFNRDRIHFILGTAADPNQVGPSFSAIRGRPRSIQSAMQFERRYAERSNLSLDDLHRRNRWVFPCNCGDDCPGWQCAAITTIDEYTVYYWPAYWSGKYYRLMAQINPKPYTDVDVYPLKDIQPHKMGADCSCSPAVSVEGAGLLILHNAHDHREIIEQAIDIMNNGGDAESNQTLENQGE